jgi:hypothetical protein
VKRYVGFMERDHLQSSPVEPFGDKDDFDVSKTHVVYTTLDPELPPAWHTKQNVSLKNSGFVLRS